MADVEHNTITDPNIHEPKGAAAASNGQTIRADGSGSTSWDHPQKNTLIEYGHLYTRISDAATLSSIGTTVQDLTFANAGVSNESTLNQANGTITVSSAGVYEINFSMTFKTSASADAGLYTCKVAVNGTASVLEVETELSGSSDTSSMSVSGLLTLAASDVVKVTIESDEAADTDDISIRNNSLSVKLVRAT